MKVVGIAGWSGSGKTTLVVKLVRTLSNRGFSVSTVKHAHHEFDIDQPGKDSYEHRAAGAREVLVSSTTRWALVHEHQGGPELAVDEVVARLEPVDLVIVEGYKHHSHDKIEIHRPALGQPLLAIEDAHILAVVSDALLKGLAIPVFDRDNVGAITDFLIAHFGLVGAGSPARRVQRG
jgi:molybdopterin-guanine dinucleotide biosynthesis protein B